MRLNITIRRRLDRLEKRLGVRKPFPVILAGVHPDEQPGTVIGVNAGETFVPIMLGESQAELIARASATLPPSRFPRFLTLAYADEGSPHA